MILALVTSVLLGVTPQMPLSVAGTDDALAVFANPAGLGAGHGSDFYGIYNFRVETFSELYRNTTFAGNLGPLAAFWEPAPSRYGLAFGAGAPGFMLGVRYMRDKLNHWSAGAMSRPVRWLSLGAVWQDFNRDRGVWMAGIAVRPLGNRLTLFADASLMQPLRPVYGFEVEPVDGISLAARILPEEKLSETNFSAGLTFGLGRAAVGALGTRYPEEVAGVLRLGEERRRTILPRAKRYLAVKLRAAVEDQQPGFSLSPVRTRTTWSLLDMLRRATEDKGVTALLLELDGASMSLAHAQEVRLALDEFRKAGKKLYIYANDYGMLSYYLASAADRVICHPQGGVVIPGVSMQMPFLKGTLEKLGVKVNYTRHGKYKSAVEVFSEDSMSPANREQYQAILDGAYDGFLSGFATGRGFSRDSVEKLVDIGIFLATDARAAGLVDTACYRDELDDLLKSEFKGRRKVEEGVFVAEEDYDYDWQAGPAVAVIYASGSIGNGESGTDFLFGSANMGAQTMVRAIEAARKNKRVKAIVLRIDSPGGDGFASDLIWHAIEKTRTKKPVIVSMAGVAGSGGYYIACNANRIYALPGTITGSIGVFSLKLVIEGLYNKLGIKRQTMKRGEHADAQSDVREYTPEEDSLIQAQIDKFYSQFVQKVADGRHMTWGGVDSVGQGRVWTGRDAQQVGLVDSLGGLLQAVAYAKQEAHLKECDYLFYPKPKTDWMSHAGSFVRERVLAVLYE